MNSESLTPRLRETLAVFDDAGEPRTTPEVAAALDLGRRAVYARLEQLAEQQLLRTKKVGASARVWWLPRENGQAPVETTPGVADQTVDRDHSPAFCPKHVLDEAPAGITVTDPAKPDNPIVYANETFRELTGYSTAEVRGKNCRLLQGPETASEPVAQMRAAVDSGDDVEVELKNYRADGSEFWNQVSITPLTDDDGSVVNFVGFQQDITERKRLEHERSIRIEQQEVVATLGEEALEDHDLDTVLQKASKLLVETLDIDYCKILELDKPAGSLRLRQGFGWEDGVVGTATVSAHDDDSQAAYTLATEEPVVVEDLQTDERFSGPELLTDHDVSSGISTIIGSPGDPWGILGTHDTVGKEFTEQDVTFVQSVANILATAINRKRDREQLRQKAANLATLVNLNTVVNETTESIIAKSTREEIEQVLCDELAGSDSYESAWLAGIDGHRGTLELRTMAGRVATSQPLAADELTNWGPALTAMQTQEMQVLWEVSGTVFETGESNSEYRTVAAVPIVHDESVYGVLGVSTDRMDAFSPPEQTVLSRFGEVVGHAIAAVERKRALISEDVVELTFRVPDIFEDFPTVEEPTGTITFDELIPVENDRFLVYGTVSEDARPQLEATVGELPGWEAVSFRDAGGDTGFELELSDQPVLSTLLSLGGTHEKSIIEDGEYRLTVQLAPTARIRQLVDAVRSFFPDVELVTRRQTTRSSRETTQNDVVDSLTDRQQSTLRAAYHGGLFEWPRDSTAEDIADSLGIAPSTFHQHLRKAEQAVMESVLSFDREPSRN